MQFCVDTLILMLLLRLPHCLNLLPSDTFKFNNLIMSSCRHSLTADKQNALLLLRFNFTNPSKADNNICDGLLK
jgi:hypothetical protein